jgi:hypothetical protein
MSRLYKFLGLVTLIAFALMAQTHKPDFTGVWHLNIKESKRGIDSPLLYYLDFKQEIRQHGDEVEIKEDIIGQRGIHRISVFAFKLDGREYRPTSGLSGSVSGYWKGDTLVETFRDLHGEVIRKMHLSPDGRRILAEWRFNPITRTPQLATEVWDRQ